VRHYWEAKAGAGLLAVHKSFAWGADEKYRPFLARALILNFDINPHTLLGFPLLAPIIIHQGQETTACG